MLDLLCETPRLQDLVLCGIRLAALRGVDVGAGSEAPLGLKDITYHQRHSPHIAFHLTSLELGTTQMRFADAMHIATQYMPCLTSLGMSDNCLCGTTPAPAHVPAVQPQPQPHPRIASLALARNNITDWSWIVETARLFPALAQLDLSGNPLEPVPADMHLPAPLASVPVFAAAAVAGAPDPALNSTRPPDPSVPTHAPALGLELESKLEYDAKPSPRPGSKSLVLHDVPLGWGDLERLDRYVASGGLFAPRPGDDSEGVGIQSLQVTFLDVGSSTGATSELEAGGDAGAQFGQLAPSDEACEGMIRSDSWAAVPPLVGRAALVARLPSLACINHTPVSQEERTAAERALLEAAQRILPTLAASRQLDGPASTRTHDPEWANRALGVQRLAGLAQRHGVLLGELARTSAAPTPAPAPAQEQNTTLGAALLALTVVVVDQPLPPHEALSDPGSGSGAWAVDAAAAAGAWAAAGEAAAAVPLRVLPSTTPRMLRSRLVRALGVPRSVAGTLDVVAALGGLSRTAPLVRLDAADPRPLADLGVASGDVLLVSRCSSS